MKLKSVLFKIFTYCILALILAFCGIITVFQFIIEKLIMKKKEIEYTDFKGVIQVFNKDILGK